VASDAPQIDRCRSKVFLDPAQEGTRHFRRDQLPDVEITEILVVAGNIHEKKGGPKGPPLPF
jgi:hypothetical protein